MLGYFKIFLGVKTMSFAKKFDLELDDLPSMTPRISKILKQNRITSVSTLAATSLRELVGLYIDSDTAQTLIDEADATMRQSGFGFVMGSKLLDEVDQVEVLTTGCKSLDVLLGGGLDTQRLYEFYGPNGVGKTNFLHQLICTAMLPKSKGGLASRVVYIDAEGNFSTKRIRMIAPEFDLNVNQVIKNIPLIKIHNISELLSTLEHHLYPEMEQTGARVVLLDSITYNVRGEYIGEKNLPIRQGTLGKIAHALKKASQAFNAVVVVVNQITKNPKTDEVTYSGGNVLGHAVQVRVSMTKAEKESNDLYKKDSTSHKIRFFVDKAVDLPRQSCIVMMDSRGFRDIEPGSQDAQEEVKAKQEV